MQQNVCYPNPTGKWIRVGLCLAVMIIAVVFKRWIGLLAIFPLISALHGSCPSGIRLGRRRSSQSDPSETEKYSHR